MMRVAATIHAIHTITQLLQAAVNSTVSLTQSKLAQPLSVLCDGAVTLQGFEQA